MKTILKRSGLFLFTLVLMALGGATTGGGIFKTMAIAYQVESAGGGGGDCIGGTGIG